jgi:hypothetical protein
LGEIEIMKMYLIVFQTPPTKEQIDSIPQKCVERFRRVQPLFGSAIWIETDMPMEEAVSAFAKAVRYGGAIYATETTGLPARLQVGVQ